MNFSIIQTVSEILLHMVPSWHKKGTELAIEKVPSLSEKGAKLQDELAIDYQDFISEYFKKVPCYVEKGAKLIGQNKK